MAVPAILWRLFIVCNPGRHNYAGPHAHRCYFYIILWNTWCNIVMKTNGWKWEPQAPQMANANKSRPSSFSSNVQISSNVTALFSNTYYTTRRVMCIRCWKLESIRERVWATLESAEIARGFLFAYRIAKTIYKLIRKKELRVTHFSKRL